MPRAWLVDVRDRRAFAREHIAGALNFELGDSLSAYLGWLLPFDAPICLLVDDPAQEVEVVRWSSCASASTTSSAISTAAWTAGSRPAARLSSNGTADRQELAAIAHGGRAAGRGAHPRCAAAERVGRGCRSRQPTRLRGRPAAVVAEPRSLRSSGWWRAGPVCEPPSPPACSMRPAIHARPVVDGGIASLPPERAAAGRRRPPCSRATC